MTIQMDKKHLMRFLRVENERIMDLLITCKVPDSVEDTDYESYLLPNDKPVNINKQQILKNSMPDDELQDRLNLIKNKMKMKKGTSEKNRERKEAKKLRKNKEFKKVLISAAKSLKNEQSKQIHTIKHDDDEENESKRDIKPIITKPIFNEEGKIVFSKIDFAQKRKQSHKNPREILNELKETDKKINELKEQGDIIKASELKTELSWKKAFDKADGKKVKDDPKLLYKTIKKHKLEKKKSKMEWQDREKKVDNDIAARQKKRQENINKRIKDNQIRKLKRASKKGRVIPGF
ncbi:surfeit locus protein 6 [Glossina fuscipes fuscipes]